jgi:phosphohistidine swiveling domain-containing protein
MVYNIDDFELTFEADGLSVVGQEIILLNYLPPQSMQCYVQGHLSAFISKASLEQKRIEGVTLYKDTSRVRTLVKKLFLEAESLEQFCKSLAGNVFSTQAIEALYEHAERVHAGYQYIDTFYTDGAFEHKDEMRVSDSLKVAEESKNVFREKFSELFFERGKNFLGVVMALAEQQGIPVEDVLWYRKSEVLDLVQGKKVSDESMTARKKACVFYEMQGEFVYHEGKTAEDFMERFGFFRSQIETKVFRGMVAHGAGTTVTGRVRIINSDYEHPERAVQKMSAMDKGMVLVSTTTAPDLMPALRKAAAIVTDVGGMLSHAGIVARELNIPCIVGTQNVSKQLKDGDLVEVDADNGVVRVIEKQK